MWRPFRRSLNTRSKAQFNSQLSHKRTGVFFLKRHAKWRGHCVIIAPLQFLLMRAWWPYSWPQRFTQWPDRPEPHWQQSELSIRRIEVAGPSPLQTDILRITLQCNSRIYFTLHWSPFKCTDICIALHCSLPFKCTAIYWYTLHNALQCFLQRTAYWLEPPVQCSRSIEIILDKLPRHKIGRGSRLMEVSCAGKFGQNYC